MAQAQPEARRALVLHDRPLVVDLIELTLNHGLFVVQSATSLGAAEAILAEWRPHLAVIDMDHDDSTALLQSIVDTSALSGSRTPALGLTRRGDLKTKLRAFDLGVDDILTMPFSPEELLARPRATSSTATSGACGSSSRTTTGIRASLPRSPARATGSSPPSRTRVGPARTSRRRSPATDRPAGLNLPQDKPAHDAEPITARLVTGRHDVAAASQRKAVASGMP